jgi:heat shock protein HslJ
VRKTGGITANIGAARTISALALALALAASHAAGAGLADPRWRLVEFRSMDDAIGVVRPHDSALYTMHLKGDGTVAMHLNCNRATGTWASQPSRDVSNGRFEFGPLAATRALCPPPTMDERIAADARFVRGYLLKDGRLHLSLMADAGIYAWEPEIAKSPATVVPAAPEDGGAMGFLGSLFVGKPLNIVAVAAAFLALYAAKRYMNIGQRGHARWPLAAAIAWAAYAAWEWLVHVVTPEANIRVDLLLIYPVLALLSAWALFRAFR